MNTSLQRRELLVQHRLVDQSRSATQQQRQRRKIVFGRGAITRSIANPVARPRIAMETAAKPVALNNPDAIGAAQLAQLGDNLLRHKPRLVFAYHVNNDDAVPLGVSDGKRETVPARATRSVGIGNIARVRQRGALANASI